MANKLADGINMADFGVGSPPASWTGTRYEYLDAGGGAVFLMYVTTVVEEGDTLTGVMEVTSVDTNFSHRFIITVEGVIQLSEEITGPTSIPFDIPLIAGGAAQVFFATNDDQYPDQVYFIEATITPTDPPSPTVSYNCECQDNSGNRTLKELRDDLARRLGYGAQVNNLPPGMTDLLNSFLQGAQRALYRRYDVLRTERIYAWDLVPGVRYYDLDGNSDTCTKRLDSRKVTWVGVERAGVWYPLICGITPERYSFDQTGQPTRYEIRQCIEIWPGPDSEPAKLRIKGHFELEPFVADTDKTTIDDELVFLMALANAKAHYGKPDAGNYIQQMEVMMANLVAGSHHTRRYIPNTRREGVEAEPRWTVDSWPPP